MLCVKLFEIRVVESRSLFGTVTKREEKVCWEQWYIPVRLVPAPAAANAPAERLRCARNVTVRLQQIVDVVNNPKHYIPLLTSNLKVPFPYEIAPVKTGDAAVAAAAAAAAATTTGDGGGGGGGGAGFGDIWGLLGGAAMK
jgi:hypothetical protein